jgi:hypothetical protein
MILTPWIENRRKDPSESKRCHDWRVEWMVLSTTRWGYAPPLFAPVQHNGNLYARQRGVTMI